MKGSNLELVEGKWQIKYATTTNGGSVELEVPEEVKHSGNYKWMYLSEDTKVIIKNHGSQYDVFNFTYYTAKDIEYSTSSDYYAEAGNNLFMKNVSFNKKTGIYVCLATDSYGRATGIAAAYEVQVCSDLKLKPVKDKHEYCLGDKVVLAVELYTSQSLNDAYYTWYFEGQEIYSSDKYSDYVIDGITSKQFGRYTLVVDDGIGSQVLDITVSRSASDIRPVLKPVTTIKTISRTDTKVRIQWNSSSNNAGITTRYGVFVHNGSKWVLLGKTTKTSETITGLKPGKAYKIAVRPYAFFRVENVWASTYKAITIYTVPSNSAVFIHHKIARTSVTAKWSKAAGATGYIVYKKVGTKWVKQGVTTKQYYTYKGLKRNTKYTFAVRPYTKIGNKVVTSKNPTILILNTAR
jgi:hypothetical protein